MVEANFFYYQKTKDIKQMARVEIYLKDYRPFMPDEDPIYKLRLTY